MPGRRSLFVAGFFHQLPAARSASPAIAPITDAEAAATLLAMKPPKRARPVIAVIGAKDGTETTDYLVPYAVLKRSGVGEVLALATKPGPIRMRPALSIFPDVTAATFDDRFPEGADYVVVPALDTPDDPETVAWIRAQAGKGATIVGVCDGVLVLLAAGLLDGRRATGHWLTIDGTSRAHPTMRRVRDRRYVADRGLVTTTGVSASLPVSLALVEAIGGAERARALANEIGAEGWGAEHDSGAFHLTRTDVFVILGSVLSSLWTKETIGIPVTEGVDLIPLSFTADAYARTFRTRVVTLAVSSGPVRTDQGLSVIADGAADAEVKVEAPADAGARALKIVLTEIAARYGYATADLIRLQLEYPEAVSAATMRDPQQSRH